MKKLLKLSGSTGQVILYENRVLIKRKGLIFKLSNSRLPEKDLYFNEITDIQIRHATNITDGFIHFSTRDEDYRPSYDTNPDELVNSENAVLFNEKANDDAVKLQDLIYRFKK